MSATKILHGGLDVLGPTQRRILRACKTKKPKHSPPPATDDLRQPDHRDAPPTYATANTNDSPLSSIHGLSLADGAKVAARLREEVAECLDRLDQIMPLAKRAGGGK